MKEKGENLSLLYANAMLLKLYRERIISLKVYELALIWLAIVNLLFFICFGLIKLVKAYEFYNTEHMAWIKNKLQESEKE